MDTKIIIDEIARRHKVRLAQDDPILATVTAIEIVHQLFAEHLRTLVTEVANQATDRLAAEIETGRHEVANQAELAKATASRLINEAGAWSVIRLEEAGVRTASAIHETVTVTLATLQAEIKEAVWARRVATLAAGAAAVFGALSFGGGVGFWLAGH